MQKKLIYLVSLFVTSLLISNIIAGKLVYIYGITVPAAVFIFPLTFLITDSINEVWGAKVARETVYIGFFMNIILVVFIKVAGILPPATFYEHQDAFDAVLGTVPRIVAASLTAYLISQLHDVWAFNFWRRITSGKHLWLRNNLSTISSQFFDSIIFITIAFAGQFLWNEIMALIISQFLLKTIFALIDTPFCYLLIKWLKNNQKEDLSFGK